MQDHYIKKSTVLPYTTNKQSWNKKNSIYNSIKKKKIPRNKFNKRSATLVHWKLQNIFIERNQGLKKMTRHPKLMDGKT